MQWVCYSLWHSISIQVLVDSSNHNMVRIVWITHPEVWSPWRKAGTVFSLSPALGPRTTPGVEPALLSVGEAMESFCLCLSAHRTGQQGASWQCSLCIWESVLHILYSSESLRMPSMLIRQWRTTLMFANLCHFLKNHLTPFLLSIIANKNKYRIM